PRLLFVPVKQAASWLWEKLWDWPFVAWLVATICIGVGVLLAQEHISYPLARALLIIGAVIVVFKVRHDAIKAGKPHDTVVAICGIVIVVISVVLVGALWIVRRME